MSTGRTRERRPGAPKVVDVLGRAARSYLANAGIWLATAAVAAVVGALTIDFLVLSQESSDIEYGRSWGLTFVLSLLALIGGFFAMRVLHWCVAFALSSETAGRGAAPLVERPRNARAFAATFVGGLVVLLMVGTVIVFAASAIGSLGLGATSALIALAVVVPLLLFALVAATESAPGTLGTYADALRTAKRRPGLFVGCFSPFALIWALAAWIVVVIDIPAMWELSGTSTVGPLASTFVVVLLVQAVAVQPAVLVAAFVHRSAGRDFGAEEAEPLAG